MVLYPEETQGVKKSLILNRLIILCPEDTYRKEGINGFMFRLDTHYLFLQQMIEYLTRKQANLRGTEFALDSML
jgi:hypothetical protein